MTLIKPVVLPTFACSRVTPLPYAFSCHSALRDILARSAARASELGLLTLSDAQALYAASAEASSGTLRAGIEELLTGIEAARGGGSA